MSFGASSDAPAEQGKLSLWQRLAYASGNYANMTTGYGVLTLAPFFFTLSLGVDPALVGLALALPRFVDLFTDPLVGYFSDRVLGRFSRQAFIGAGAAISALFFGLVWWVPVGLSQREDFYWLCGFSCLTAVGWSVLTIPWQALGFELTPDYHERTRLMAISTLVLGLAGIVYGWSIAATQLPIFHGLLWGARWVGLIMAVSILVTGLITARFSKSPRPAPTSNITTDRVPREKQKSIGLGRVLLRVFKSRPFLHIVGAVFLMSLGVFCVSILGQYISTFFIEQGDKRRGSILIGIQSTFWQGTCLLLPGFIGRISRHIEKNQALILFLFIALLGNVIKWVCYNPAYAWLSVIPYVLFAAGFTGLWTLAPSMVADICDYERMRSGFSDDGTFAGIYTWSIKLGSTAAFLLSGVLINLTGFRAAIVDQGVDTILRMRWVDFSVPALTIALAIGLLWSYPLSESVMKKMRESALH